jgi:predicted small metal-binding protein
MALMEVVCRCGWSIRGSEREVIAEIRDHARADHGLSMTARDVKAIWRVVDVAPGADAAGPTST